MKNKILLVLLLAAPLYASYIQTTPSGGGGGGGISTINADSSADQVLQTGTAGTDFGISDNGTGTHTFNLPTASATARGLMSTGAQTIAGQKTFSSAPICSALTASQAVVTDGSKQLASLPYASTNTVSSLVERDGSGNFSAGTISAALNGNASTATALAANPTDCSAGQYATAIDASGNLTCANPFTGMVEQIDGDVYGTVADDTYPLRLKAKYAFTINELSVKLLSGTTTVAVKINGTNVTGLSAVSVTSTASTTSATGANTVAAGDTVELVTSSGASAIHLAASLKITR